MAGSNKSITAIYMVTAAIGFAVKSKNIPILPSERIKDCLSAFSARGHKTIDNTAGATG